MRHSDVIESRKAKIYRDFMFYEKKIFEKFKYPGQPCKPSSITLQLSQCLAHVDLLRYRLTCLENLSTCG